MSEPFVALDARLVTSRNTGDTSYWRGLVRAFSEHDWGLRFLLFGSTPQPEQLPTAPWIEWVVVPGDGRAWSLTKFPLEARKRGASVIHTQYSLSPLAGRIGVTTIHDVSFFVGPEWFKAKDRLILSKTVPASVKRAAKVITVSKTSKSEIVQYTGCDPRKVVVTYNALGDNIRTLSKTQAEVIVRERLGIHWPYVLTVGTRWPRKNMSLAIEAVQRLPDTMPHKIVVTGSPGWGENVTADRTHMTGYVDDESLTALYLCAELYVAPSRHEGFGIPLLEAWACGCPVACSTGGALPEVAGNAALVIEGWEPEAWSRQIADLLSNSSKLATLRGRGKERLNLFSWHESAQKTVEVYRDVIG